MYTYQDRRILLNLHFFVNGKLIILITGKSNGSILNCYVITSISDFFWFTTTERILNDRYKTNYFLMIYNSVSLPTCMINNVSIQTKNRF